MSDYRRLYQDGATYFFTVVTHKRRPIFKEEKNIQIFKQSISAIKKSYPFEIKALVILPDHIHTLWEMPTDEQNFSLRWQLIKLYCSKRIPVKPLWQNRFWEHLVRDEKDMNRHYDYIYYNPVKHGLVTKAIDWPYSTFKRDVELGIYDKNWGLSGMSHLDDLDFE